MSATTAPVDGEPRIQISDSARNWSLGLMTLAVTLITLDSTIANIALPHIQGTLSTTLDQLGWVLTSYIIANAISMPLSGFLCDRFGHRRVLVPAVFFFTLTSTFCGMAQSLEELVLFRFLQGLVGGLVIPSSQSLMLIIFTRAQYTKALTIWSLGMIIGPILGPSLGGYLTDAFSWRWVFLINLPIGLMATVGMFIIIPKVAINHSRRMDFMGFALLSLAAVCLQLVFDRGQGQGWFDSWEIIVECSLVVIFALMFAIYIGGAKSPYLRMECFRDRNFSVGCFFMFTNCVVLFACMALLPGFMQNLLNIPVMTSGLLLVPRGAGSLLALFVINRFGARADYRLLIGWGLACTALSLAIMDNFNLEPDINAIVISGLIQGFGLSMSFLPNNLLTFSTLKPHLHSDGAAIIGLVRSLASSLGISIMFVLLARKTQYFHAQLVESVTPFHQWLNFPKHWDWNSPIGATLLNGELTRQAALQSYLFDFNLMKWLAIIAILLLFLAKSEHPPAIPVEASKD